MEKKWYQSRTIWVNAVSAVAALSVVFGFDLNLDGDAQAKIVAGIMAVVNGINGALRFDTDKPIRRRPGGQE